MKPDDPHWHSRVQAPRVAEDPDALAWTDEADVVVVGFGGAGATTALRCAELGLSVLALDKATGGGATEASGGVFYAGGGTRVQKSLGEVDSPENMFAYLKMETGGVVGDATLRRFCERSAAQLEWLMKQGVRFGGPVWKRKTSYPQVRYFLYHSDNSLLPAYQAEATPAARGHRGLTRKGRSAVNLGGAIHAPLRERFLELGGELALKADVYRLVTDPQGAVLGVEARRIPPDGDAFHEHESCLKKGRRLMSAYPFFLPGARAFHARAERYLARARELEERESRPALVRARLGVCLAAGGFIFNRKMVRHHCPDFQKGMPLGTPGDDGAGIRLGQSAGGASALMHRATAWRFINPPAAWAEGIIVDERGARLVNESCYGATIGDALVTRAGGKGWLLLDGRLLRRAWRQLWPTRVLPFQWQLGALNLLFGRRKFRTPEALCAALGFDRKTLAETLEEVRKTAAGLAPDRFGKAREDSHALRFPLHVIDVSLGAPLLPCTVMTMGGLRVDEATGQVLSEDGKPVPGLYAAGRTAVGLPSHLYMSGLSIADCVFSGLRVADRLAGRQGCPGEPGSLGK